MIATSIVVVAADLLGIFVGTEVMKYAWAVIMRSYNGWFKFVMTPADYGKMFIFVLAGYLLVTIIDYKRIKKIPMDEALKNMDTITVDERTAKDIKDGKIMKLIDHNKTILFIDEKCNPLAVYQQVEDTNIYKSLRGLF